MTEQSPAERIFFAALEKATAEERAAYVRAACGDDSNLRRRVERLLAAHPQVGSFLEAPAQGEVAQAEAPTIPPCEKCSIAPGLADTSSYHGPIEAAGAVIAGRYKLVEQIGEGGMGTVWVAQQTEPVKRIVAVKLIKTGMDSKAVLARFEAERQALALMEHPNIARVLDGGATADGRPFFVMELVKGVPITQFCDARKLTPRQRLELFVPVCQAIQHAHQKGIIHRDIKPSNVLIALYDDKPVPKVIDFGVAKATGQTLTDKSLMTGFGAVVGTPEYMSPEQASLNNLDIDTRSDVYSLGVLLYELLAGSPPFSSDELEKAGLFEVLRVVCEEEPPRPSIKLSTANKLASISADRGTEPTKLAGLLRNELDWIVMKALEKDRRRRYETVNGFAADVNRYLAGEAVQAHPPSAGYRLRKFARKHRVAIATAATFAGLLIAAAVVSGWLAVKASRAEAEAQAKTKEAHRNAAAAQENAAAAERQTALAKEWAGKHLNARVEAELHARRLQVDLDLEALKGDPRLGLLRLAKPYKQTLKDVKREYRSDDPNLQAFLNDPQTQHEMDPGGFRPLREFAAAAVLAAGQDYAPLLPPLTHDGHAVVLTSLSPDKQTLLTFGKDFTARLWDARTAKQIVILRKGDEKVIACGFSPDGRTVFTDDQTSIARFWDVPSGKFRAATEARPNRRVLPEAALLASFPPSAQIGLGRLLTQRFVGKDSDLMGGSTEHVWEGPAELWDTATGRLVARLEAPSVRLANCRFLGERWIAAIEGSAVLVFSAADGHLLARLVHPAGEEIEHMEVSPSGRRLATVSGKRERPSGPLGVQAWDAHTIHLWHTESWEIQGLTRISAKISSFCLRFLMDEAPGGGEPVVALGMDGGWKLFRGGFGEPIAEFPGAGDCLAHAGDLVHGGNGWVCDARTWQRLLPPPGRKFHPDLARFAADGGFVRAALSQEEALIDVQTDKALLTGVNWEELPGFGMVAVSTLNDRTATRLLPTSRLSIPPDLLELWAQVVVRGELGPDGRFLQWDEEKWEKNRQELAAKPTPIPGFPFPGHVATDKLHWLRAEFDEAKKEAEKLRLARELLRRCEAAGDRNEAVRWRAVLAPKPPAK